jgi:opacity protein-like surface antigen
MWRRATRSCGLVIGLTVYPLAAMAQGTGEPTGTSGAAGTAGASTSGAAGTGVMCEAAKVVEFKGTSAVLSSDAKMTLDQIAMTAKDPGSSVRLLGSSGQKKRATKAKIAERRTDAVKGYLAEAGLNPALITTSPPDPAAPKPDVIESVEIVTCAQPVAQAPLPPSPPIAAVPETPPPADPLPSEVPQPPMEPVPMASVPTEPVPAPSYLHPVKTNVGVEAMVGGSVMGFADEQARSVADTGGGWEARLSVGTRLPLAVEAAYVGSAQNIEALGLDDAAVLVGSAAEAVARVNFTRNLKVQPYVFGGVGWQHYDLTNAETNNSAIREDDDLFTIPAGAGISFRLVKGLILDVRGTFRTAFDEDLMNAAYSATGQDANLHTWDAGARLGWEF